MRLLTLSGREAWIHQLCALGMRVDLLTGPGLRDWDASLRPVPDGAHAVSLEAAIAASEEWECVIAHGISDLVAVEEIDRPKLLVLHETLEGRDADGDGRLRARTMRAMLNSSLVTAGAHAIAVSRLRARSWGVTHVIVNNAVDPRAYPTFTGEEPRGLRVISDVPSDHPVRAQTFLQSATAHLPMTVVASGILHTGHALVRDWEDLKYRMSTHRFLIHTADPRHEDGFDYAVLEAMAAGMPVLVNRHPSTIVQHGVSGFLCDSPQEMRERAVELLADQGLAVRLGAAAREQVHRFFPPQRFGMAIQRAVTDARRKWERRRALVAR